LRNPEKISFHVQRKLRN